MTLAELRALFREEAGDTAEPFLWPNLILNLYANEAQTEACRRGHLLRDSVTTAICQLAVTAGDPIVELDPRILDIQRMRLASQFIQLRGISVQEMDDSIPGWENQSGLPWRGVTDYQSNAIRLWPSPSANDVLKLSVIRLPLVDMVADTDEPEIRKEYHPQLVQWMLHRAYAKQDSEVFDANKSQTALANFEKEFGSRSSARNAAWRAERQLQFAPPIA